MVVVTGTCWPALSENNIDLRGSRGTTPFLPIRFFLSSPLSLRLISRPSSYYPAIVSTVFAALTIVPAQWSRYHWRLSGFKRDSHESNNNRNNGGCRAEPHNGWLVDPKLADFSYLLIYWIISINYRRCRFFLHFLPMQFSPATGGLHCKNVIVGEKLNVFFVGNSTIFYVKEKEEILNVRGKKKKRIVMQPALACMYIWWWRRQGRFSHAAQRGISGRINAIIHAARCVFCPCSCVCITRIPTRRRRRRLDKEGGAGLYLFLAGPICLDSYKYRGVAASCCKPQDLGFFLKLISSSGSAKIKGKHERKVTKKDLSVASHRLCTWPGLNL